MNSEWETGERLDRFADHIKLLEKLGNPFNFEITHEVNLLSLAEAGLPSYALVLDKPLWFHREGAVTLNLFKNRLRLFSLTFSLEENGAGLHALIGGLQGRKVENVMEEYRIFTKAAHGVRPRDFLIESFRMLATAAHVSTISAVSNACRHQRHPYFGPNRDRELPLDYDEAWANRGGQRETNAWHALPLAEARDLEDVPAKKRAMYRRRFEMLSLVELGIRTRLHEVQPVLAVEAD